MAEGLGEVAEQLAAGRVDLLGQQPQVVGVAEEPLEQGGGPVGLAGEGEVVDQPEAGDHKARLAVGEPVVGPEVAVDKPVGGQFAGGALHGGADAGVVGGEEADQRQQQIGGVQGLAAERLGERAAGRIDPGPLDPAADGTAQSGPAVQVGGQVVGAGQANGAVDRDPGQDLGGDEVTGPPRTSQMPSSGSVQRRATTSTAPASSRQKVGVIRPPWRWYSQAVSSR